MNYTKEHLEIVKHALLNLISADRKLTSHTCGVCYNLDNVVRMFDIDGYEIIDHFGHMWPKNGLNQNVPEDYGYVVVENENGQGNW